MVKEQADYRSNMVRSGREKAMAACEVGNTIIEMGEPKTVAAEMASHELKHALAHQGTGYFGVESNDFFVKAYYATDEELDEETKKKIAEAPGVDHLSVTDMKHAGRIRGILKFLFGDPV